MGRPERGPPREHSRRRCGLDDVDRPTARRGLLDRFQHRDSIHDVCGGDEELVAVGHRLREGLEFITRLQYDARRRRFNEQTYGLAFAVANTWLVTSSVSVYSGRKRESSFGFDLRVDALRF